MITYTLHQQDQILSLIDHVYSIIDSRLQYISFQIKRASKQLENQINSQMYPPEGSNYVVNGDSRFLSQIENASKCKKLLLTIRSLICLENINTAFQLLQDRSYLNYSEKDLKTKLDLFSNAA